MGYRLINIDKVLLVDFVRFTNSKLVTSTINEVTTIKLKFADRAFELFPKFYKVECLSGMTMDDSFNYTTGILPKDFNREVLTNIINIYNKRETS